MERRGQRRDTKMPNSTNFNPSQITQQSSPLKQPVAPTASTPPGIRGIATVFSPYQTVDHHLHPPQPPQHHQQRLPVQKEATPDPDPDPAPSTADDASISMTPPPHPQPPPPPPQPPTPASTTNKPSTRYKECLKNHAASMGGNAVDGCREFMPSGDEGTAEAFRCAACECHRNFHRKEVDGEPPHSHQRTSPAIPQPHRYRHSRSYSQAFASGSAPPATSNFDGCSSGAATESSSEDLKFIFQSSGSGSHAVVHPSFSRSKKRFRTKFSQEQKDRMQELAEKLGWRIQRHDEEEVEKFCNETGLNRKVFKVWMQNNKQAVRKRQT